MKKFILIAAISFASLTISATFNEAKAQVVTMTGSGDTVVNTETEYILYKAPTNYVVSIQLQATKLSGTAAGTATIQGSIDGVSYVAIPGQTVDTLTNVTSQGYLWTFSPSPYVYYRIAITGSGTMAVRVYGYMVSKKL